MAAEKAYAPDLPETTIHQIQSFLTGKEAAKTTLLSDSWRGAWSTRPAIVLAEADFPTRYRYSSYNALMLYFAKKTFRRYEQSNLSIDTFVLSLQSKWYCRSGRAVKWISKALKLGATDLTLVLGQGAGMAVPAVDAVFRSERVVTLCLLGLTIELELNVVKCSGLKSLTLKSSWISGDSFFKLLSCCPLIENLSLTDISGLGVEPAPPTITLLKLRSLVLFCVSSDLVSELKTLFLDDLSSKLPNLLNLSLSLGNGAGGEMIRNISSATLETLSLMNTYMYPRTSELQFHVPSICEFTFDGDEFPNLSFRSKPQHHWVSRVSITTRRRLSAWWFCELGKFLAKIHLSCLYVRRPPYACYEYYKAEEIKGVEVSEVETATMDTEGCTSPDFDVLLDGLFRICRPNTVDASPPNNSHAVKLRRALEQGTRMVVKSSSLPQSHPMYALCNLEEVNVQELVGNVWRSQPLDTIKLDDSTCNEQRRYRFQLKWKCNDVVA